LAIPNIDTATYADDAAVAHNNRLEASLRLKLQRWLKKWRIKAKETKSVQVTFGTRRETWVTLNALRESLKQKVPNICRATPGAGRLNWKKRIFIKRKQLGPQLGRMYRLLGSKSQLSTENRLLLAILKPIWAGIQLWDTASNSNTEILQRFRNKFLESSLMHLGMLPMTLYELNVYIRDEDTARHMLTGWRSILTYSRQDSTQNKKGTFYALDRSYRVFADILQDFMTPNCHMYY